MNFSFCDMFLGRKNTRRKKGKRRLKHLISKSLSFRSMYTACQGTLEHCILSPDICMQRLLRALYFSVDCIFIRRHMFQLLKIEANSWKLVRLVSMVPANHRRYSEYWILWLDFYRTWLWSNLLWIFHVSAYIKNKAFFFCLRLSFLVDHLVIS